MKQLDNNGFAITGILYTLFVLFLLILITILAGLSYKKNILEHSVSIEEGSFEGALLSQEEVTNASSNGIAPVKGKYIFLVQNSTTQCVTYLDKGDSLVQNEITFIPQSCNGAGLQLNLTKIYSFEKE